MKTYKLTYTLGNSVHDLICWSADVAAQNVTRLAGLGATDIQVTGPKSTELSSLKSAIRSMGLAEQEQLIADFKDYIKNYC